VPGSPAPDGRTSPCWAVTARQRTGPGTVPVQAQHCNVVGKPAAAGVRHRAGHRAGGFPGMQAAGIPRQGGSVRHGLVRLGGLPGRVAAGATRLCSAATSTMASRAAPTSWPIASVTDT